jgi:general secretion pathway protein C
MQSIIAGAATLAAAALASGVLAYWTWLALAPAVSAARDVSASLPGTAEAEGSLFGEPARAAAASSANAARLVGVAAASGGRPGYALLQFDGRPAVSVREGREAAPGVLLSEVLPDHVVLSRGGVREELALPKKNDASAAPPPAPAASQIAPRAMVVPAAVAAALRAPAAEASNPSAPAAVVPGLPAVSVQAPPRMNGP